MWFVIWLFQLLTALMVWGAELFFWLFHFGRQGMWKGVDVVRATNSIKDGELVCPQGHVVPTENEVYECGHCGFAYVGSIWQCPNPECLAVTTYCNCPVCGLSIRSPYRLGRE